MRRLASIYPDYADDVALYVVGVDPTEELEAMEAYAQQQGYPWPIAEAGEGMRRNLFVLQRSTKIAFNGDGIITYREGYGRGGEAAWRKVFAELAGGA